MNSSYTKTIAAAVAFLLFPIAAAASDDNVLCAQQELGGYGFDAGVADGLFGGKTAQAAEDFSEANPAIQEEFGVLTVANAGPWCEALTADGIDFSAADGYIVLPDGDYWSGNLAGACAQIVVLNGAVTSYQSWSGAGLCMNGPESGDGPYSASVLGRDVNTINVDNATFELVQASPRSIVGNWNFRDFSQNFVTFRAPL